MRFSLGCELAYQVEAPSVFIFNIEAARLNRQVVRRERLDITPAIEPERWVMPESGNRYLRLTAPAGELKLAYEAEVELDPRRDDPASVPEMGIGALPLATLPHLQPSRYCESDRLSRAAAQITRGLAPGHGRVTALANWIHEEIAYARGSSDTHSSAGTTLLERAGVCRDFAHLGVALCRALGVPARFVSAYAWGLEPPDFHAVFEAWLGGRWYLFDPTRQAALDGLVRIGVGRDAAEVSFASIYGPARPTTMMVRIEPVGGGDTRDPRTVAAISSSDV